jgi:hypothetical protein
MATSKVVETLLGRIAAGATDLSAPALAHTLDGCARLGQCDFLLHRNLALRVGPILVVTQVPLAPWLFWKSWMCGGGRVPVCKRWCLWEERGGGGAHVVLACVLCFTHITRAIAYHAA